VRLPLAGRLRTGRQESHDMKTVLTVDDSKVVRSMVNRYLQGYGCRLVEAANGVEGIEAAKQNKPDLILLDITMPVMDGRQALAELRNDPVCKGIPVIMLTAESGRDIVVEIAKLGISGYIVKPFQKETFDKEVGKVLGAPDGKAAPTGQESAPVDRSVVLVVDDSERVLEAARAALGQAMTVLVATSGKDALERYREKRPGVVVIDLAMPDMDGFETLTKIRELGRSAYVALAVRGDGSMHDKARKAGYQAVLEKPFQAKELLDQVQLAADGLATPEEILRAVLGEESGCSVLNVPDPRSKVFAKVLPEIGKKLRALAEDGNDRLIVDVAKISDVSAELVNFVVRLVTEADTVGIRTAICTANPKLVERLREIAETSAKPCASNRAAARQSLQ
jgi:two-component system cell cycle response regulator